MIHKISTVFTVATSENPVISSSYVTYVSHLQYHWGHIALPSDGRCLCSVMRKYRADNVDLLRVNTDDPTIAAVALVKSSHFSVE